MKNSKAKKENTNLKSGKLTPKKLHNIVVNMKNRY